MNSYHEKLAQILRVDKNSIAKLESDLENVTGRVGVMKKIVEENDRLITERLDGLGLARHAKAVDVYDALISKIEADDLKIFELIGMSSLKHPEAAQMVADLAAKLHPPARGYFLKITKAKEFLLAEPPRDVMKALGYQDVAIMLEREDILEIYSALRFLENPVWLNDIFFKQYAHLTPDDFEEREVKITALHPKWAKAAEKFVAKKYHNVSHLKELGVIFVIPLFLGISGETLRLLSLLTHYINEVGYYADIFKQLGKEGGDDFAAKIISLLRGDVLTQRPPLSTVETRPRFLVVQRYLAKDDPNDWRLFEPRINPEAVHWQKAENDIMGISAIFPRFHNGLDFWTGLGWVGDYFATEAGPEILVSFNLVDTVMALVKQKEMVKYLYHHQESLWNKIFIEYFSQSELEEKSRRHILRGWFEV